MKGKIFIQPEKSYNEIVHFMGKNDKRILLCTGVSGVGKSTLLKQISKEIDGYIYIDVSINNTPLAILQEIYRQLGCSESLIEHVSKQLSTLNRIYINNVGNISINSSNFEKSLIINEISLDIGENPSLNPDLFLESSIKKVFELLKRRPYCLLIDQFESSEDNKEILKLIRSIINNCSTVNIIISSRKIIKNNIASEEIVKKYQINGFSHEEASDYLCRREVNDNEIIKKALLFCEGHPLFLKMFADAYNNNLDFQKSLDAVAKDDRFRFLFNCIGESLPFEVRKVFYKLPLCRFFSLDLISYVFNFESFTSSEVIKVLIDDLFVEQINQSGLYRFHELFNNLQRKEIPRKERIEFDNKIILFYKEKRKEKGSINSLTELIEPFYHLQYVSSEESFKYFDSIYKPVLDKKQKSIANLLVSQIITDLHEKSKVNNWFLLRIGGFFREFGLYSEAIEFFLKILGTEEIDDDLKAYSLNNLGICYMHTDRQEEARECFYDSIEICSKLGLATINGHNYNNLGISWSNSNYLDKAKISYQTSLQYYHQDNVNDLYIGKLLQNYANLLLRENNIESALNSALAGEKKYLQDGDLIGGMDCRIVASDCLLHLGKYQNSWEIIEPHIETFDEILKEYNLKERRPHFHYKIAFCSFYYANYEMLVKSIINFLSYSLEYSPIQEHQALAYIAVKFVVLVNNKDFTKEIITNIKANKTLVNVSSYLIPYMQDLYDQKWIVLDSNQKLHTLECSNYKQGHYFNNVNIFSRSQIIQEKKYQSCQCMKSENGQQMVIFQ